MLKKSVSFILLTCLILAIVACAPQNAESPPEETPADDPAQEEQATEADESSPKNVIVMIGDGMGFGQMEIARLFEHGKEGELFMETLPNVALSRTYSANNNVTDSAAAGTALANGEKTNNGMLGVSPDGEELTSLIDIFKEQGKTVGIVSTNTVTDATPAGFVAKVPDRAGQDEIARQIFEGRYDIALGGGERFFQPDAQDGTDLIASFEEEGYDIVRNKDELNNYEPTADSKLLGLFHPSFMNYVSDREVKDSEEPTLVEMSQKAIEAASQNDDGFFLMLEGARIDHASHAADFVGIWRETIEFDNAVEYAVNWSKEDGETLVVVLADHETMGIAATEVMDMEALKEVGVSPEYISQQLELDEDTGNFTADSIRDVFAEYANIDLTDDEISQFQENVWDNDDPEGRLILEHEIGWEVGSIIAHHYRGGVIDRQVREESATGGHTGEMVPVFTVGVGAEKFNGVLDNTEIPRMIAEISGFEFELQGNE
ncbi:alkaline phosphatase [Halalkalibacter alkaliphilus]|uniref:Alkaline phosphatase n=1 Tax=Halalkalibacter alkaliphilus TaxID=2917993 RepID=A0A9X2CNN7_9BACI|nr:alkaline phosphatase [Halalkalibacter alkaliphilus]MCL7746863.1 alkaline phosphatase [Halalkalibacter alkaliphilus]